MPISRTVMFMLDVHGEIFQVARSSLAALFNLLCLSPQPSRAPPRIGVCSLGSSTSSGKVQLQIKLRPSLVDLREAHAACMKLSAGTIELAPQGQEAALATHSLTDMLLRDPASQHTDKNIVLVTDRLFNAEDFKAYLAVSGGRGVSLSLVVLCATDSAVVTAASASAAAWDEMERAYPNLSVILVEVAGRAAVQAVAQTLLHAGGLNSPPLAVSLQFEAPLLSSVRSIPLEASCDVAPLWYSISQCVACPCHGLPEMESGIAAGFSVSGPRCAVTGLAFDRQEKRVTDGKTLRIGGTPAGVLHLSTPLALSPGGGSVTLSVLSKVIRAAVDAAVLIGPPAVLRAPRAVDAGAVKVAVEGGIVDVSAAQMLQVVVATLRTRGEALICSTTGSLAPDNSGSGSSGGGLFKQHYLLVPAGKMPDENESSGAAPDALVAMRVASIEELAVAPHAPVMHGAQSAPMPEMLAAQMADQMDKLPEGSPDPTKFSSGMHKTIEILVRSSVPPPKVVAASPAPAAATPAAPAKAAAAATTRKEAEAAADGGGRSRTSKGDKRGAGGPRRAAHR